jgi:flagellar biosynthesis/type III secretory pathway protein FliH
MSDQSEELNALDCSDLTYEQVQRILKWREALVEQIGTEAQHNCNNIAEDQPNDIHIHYYNQGHKMGYAKGLLKGRSDMRKTMKDEFDKFLAGLNETGGK